MMEERAREIFIGPAGPEDRKQAACLWEKVFEDDKGYIRLFFSKYFRSDTCWVLKEEGALVCAVYLLPFGVLDRGEGKPRVIGDPPFSSKGDVPCVYAFGTLPGRRGKGLGKTLLSAALSASSKKGEPWSVICPARKELFSYYEKAYGYQSRFSVAELPLFYEKREEEKPSVRILPLSEKAYNRERERLLSGFFHLRFHNEAIGLQKEICRLYGGDLYLLEYEDGKKGCFCAFREGERLLVKELLLPELEKGEGMRPAELFDQLRAFTPALQDAFGKRKGYIRMPEKAGAALLEGGLKPVWIRDFAMLLSLQGQPLPFEEKGYFGLAFD